MKHPFIALPVLLVLPALFGSCKRSSTTEPMPNGVTSTGVRFAVGNQYYWQHMNISSGILTDSFHKEFVTNDSTIANTRYFVLTTGEVLSSSDDTVYSYHDGSQSIYYRFDVAIGQSVQFLGYVLPVTSVEFDSVFGQLQKQIMVSNESLSPDTVVSGIYATEFGLIVFSKKYGTHESRQVLMGARIDNVDFGWNP
jgi:hypothetical protein